MSPREIADQLHDIVSARVAPSMAAEEALAILEELQGDLEADIDGLRSDLGLD